MGLFDQFRPKKQFPLQPADHKMWQAAPSSGIAPACPCLEPQYRKKRFSELGLHAEQQNVDGEAWRVLLDLIETAASKRLKEFAPGFDIAPELWCQIITLPPSPRVWISLRIATDVLPLLVNACSNECITRLPPPAHGYIDRPHTGGLDVAQPVAEFMPPPR